MKTKQPIYIDVETTGLEKPEMVIKCEQKTGIPLRHSSDSCDFKYQMIGDEILEIAIVEEDGTVLLNTLVKPVRHAQWTDAMAINGITPDMVKNAPTLVQISPLIEEAVIGRDVYIWNATFDHGFLPAELDWADSVNCAMMEFGEFIQRTQPKNKSQSGRYKMARVADDLGIENEQEHRALGDVLTMIQIRKIYLAPEFNRTDLSGNLKTKPYKVVK